IAAWLFPTRNRDVNIKNPMPLGKVRIFISLFNVPGFFIPDAFSTLVLESSELSISSVRLNTSL
ncbi:MAG: hypothetical protein R3240_06460, partial [Gammaproteobacteria bacterium]|nr:hypothetical protein [Gammaproteobacteria bacterium]